MFNNVTVTMHNFCGCLCMAHVNVAFLLTGSIRLVPFPSWRIQDTKRGEDS